MTSTIEDLYKTVITIKDARQLSLKVPADVQAEHLISLIDLVTPKQDLKVLLMVTKLYIHFVMFGANSDIRDDAFTCMMIIKSFSCKQQLPQLQEICFSFYFHLLYSRSLRPEQKQEAMLEFAEFGISEESSILAKFICFYFDTKANANFNLFQHKQADISLETITNLCKAFERITQENITQFPELKPGYASLTIDTIQQRFYNQFVYGKWGLHAEPYESKKVRSILDCLVTCSKLNSQSAKKALTKSIDYLINQQHSAEDKENTDYLIKLDEDIKHGLNAATTIDFGKLKPQWDKVCNKVT